MEIKAAEKEGTFTKSVGKGGAEGAVGEGRDMVQRKLELLLPSALELPGLKN